MNPDYCKARVWHDFTSAQCQRRPKRDGYCTQHHPDTKAKRSAAQRRKWDIESLNNKLRVLPRDYGRWLVDAVCAMTEDELPDWARARHEEYLAEAADVRAKLAELTEADHAE